MFLPKILLAAATLALPVPAAFAAESARLVSPYVFTDESAVIQLPAPATGEVFYELQTITRDGFGPTQKATARPENATLAVAPLAEGIHILQLQTEPPQTVRFLALAPPARLEADTLRKTLPRSYRKLLSNQPFKLLSMGDSITNTGDYESLLVKMLGRATGNTHLSFVDRSYSGRSIDASVREWVNDGPANRPDLGLIMYGANDQITNVPLPAFLEQYAWLAHELATLNADTMFLQPTPDLGILLVAGRPFSPDTRASDIARTFGFGHALQPLGKELKVPVAQTFAALWGRGGDTLEASARKMWPLFPPSH